uniref:Protein kinase domain-containing protein n=1 Tax=Oreochromis niloticus TaxID=8128 RepID=A0A669DTX0_ORENI
CSVPPGFCGIVHADLKPGRKPCGLSAAFKLEESRIAKIQLQFPNSVEYPQKGHVNTSANPSSSEDDLEISEGTILGDHHMVESFLGEGGFGVVTRCRNTKNNQIVAIKVNKSDPEILQQAKQEIFILEQLQRLDPDRCNIVEWNGYFLDGERICLNFELLDQSLWDYIGGWNNQGLPIRELRPILHQIANALFHLGSVGIVHADLKPANIMVVNRHESPIKVKLIDFGLACNTSAVITGDRVGTVAIDMWALGLVAVELATGVPLYPGEDDYDETRYIKLKRLDDLEQLLKVRRGPENGQPLFVRLIKQMLALDANQRITPSEVLKHPFFNTGLSRSAPCTDMNSTGGENLVVSQQPSSWKSQGSQKFNCSFQNSVEYPQKGHVNTSANPSSSEDDLEISEGTILGDHHMVESFLGEGGFGVVTRCRNTKNNQIVAIKVNKSDPEILQQAKQEIFILEQLQRLDPDRCNIVEWNGYFLDGERICLNFELLDQSLWDYIGGWNNQGLPIRELRPILHQIANALFHLGSVGIVHADLKPANIMVVNRHESPIKVKLIDFGLACNFCSDYW